MLKGDKIFFNSSSFFSHLKDLMFLQQRIICEAFSKTSTNAFQQKHEYQRWSSRGRPWPQIISNNIFPELWMLFGKSTTLSKLESSKFALRLPLYKLWCNNFRFCICIFIAAQFAFQKKGLQLHYRFVRLRSGYLCNDWGWDVDRTEAFPISRVILKF